jgi:thiol-disulfide isomerase/thioredoxin
MPCFLRRPGLFLALQLAALAPLRAADTGPAWPSNVRVFEVEMTKAAAEKQRERFSLPQLRVYDAQGRLLHSSDGYDTEFGAALNPLFQGKGKAKKELLKADLATMQRAKGQPLRSLPAADFTVVELWADWCIPCHAQSRQLAGLLRSHPKRTFNLLHVEADMPKILGAKTNRPPAPKFEMDAETARKLEDPSTSTEEKDKLVEDLMLKKRSAAPAKPETVKPPTTKPPGRR